MRYVLRHGDYGAASQAQRDKYDEYSLYGSTLRGFGYGADDSDQAYTDVAFADETIPDFAGITILPDGSVVDQRRVSGKSWFNKTFSPAVPYIMAAGAAAATGGTAVGGMGAGAAGAAGGIAGAGIEGGSGLEMAAGGIGGYIGGSLAGQLGGSLGGSLGSNLNDYYARYLALLKRNGDTYIPEQR